MELIPICFNRTQQPSSAELKVQEDVPLCTCSSFYVTIDFWLQIDDAFSCPGALFLPFIIDLMSLVLHCCDNFCRVVFVAAAAVVSVC